MAAAGIGGLIGRLRGNPLVGQLIRFGIVGAASSVIYSAVYLPLTSFVLPRHLAWVAVLPAFVVAVAFGYVAHSKWSFRDHGSRDAGGARHVSFVVVQGSGMVLNMLYAWGLCDLLHYAPWVALVPAVTITPIATFLINRQLVFA